MTNALAIYENFQQTREIANVLASSDLVPPHFQKKPANVLIALEFAQRNDIAPFAAMQSLFVVKGKVGMAATMAISLARKWNVFAYLKYEVTGKDEDLKVKAIATLHDGEKVETEVTMKMAISAGWASNPLYKSIPEQMLKYRAVTFLIRAHFPEVLFGMQTVEELHDVEYAKKPLDVTPKEEVKPAPVIEAVIESKPEAKIEILDTELEDIKGELLAFLESRSDEWFKAIDKSKSHLIFLVNSTDNVASIKKFYDKTMVYDDMAKDILEKSKMNLVKDHRDVMSEALS